MEGAEQTSVDNLFKPVKKKRSKEKRLRITVLLTATTKQKNTDSAPEFHLRHLLYERSEEELGWGSAQGGDTAWEGG